MLGLSRSEIDGRVDAAQPFLPTSEWFAKRPGPRWRCAVSVPSRPVPTDLARLVPGRCHAGEAMHNVFYASYVQTYIQRNVRALARVGDELAFPRLLRAAAARTAQLGNYADLARDNPAGAVVSGPLCVRLRCHEDATEGRFGTYRTEPRTRAQEKVSPEGRMWQSASVRQQSTGHTSYRRMPAPSWTGWPRNGWPTRRPVRADHWPVRGADRRTSELASIAASVADQTEGVGRHAATI